MKAGALLLWLALITGAGAGLFYVDTNNSQARDTNAGTSLTAPWKTIGKAAATLAAGDTVYVKAGTYNESVTTGASGTAALPISYQRYGSETVIVTGAISVTRDYIEVRGFECSGGGGRITVSGAHNLVRENYVHHTTNGNGISLGGSYNTARDNRVANCGAGWGDNTGISGSDNLFEYNEVSDEESQGEDLMKFTGTNHVVQYNYFHDMVENGRHNDVFQCGGADTDGILVRGNLVTRIGGQFAMLSPWAEATLQNMTFVNNVMWMHEGQGGYGINVHSVPGLTFINNTFGRTYYGAILLRTSSTGAIIKNNIFYNSGWYSSEDPIEADYNLIYPDPTGQWAAPVKQAHDIWGIDPGFVDAAGHDFHLAAGSPAIDAGTSGSGIPDIDIDSTARFDDPATANTGGGTYTYCDLGAYEYRTTGVRTIDYYLLYSPAVFSGPNPIKAGLWLKSLEQLNSPRVYDLAGKIHKTGGSWGPGIYLVEGRGGKTFQKVVVIK